MAVPGKKKNIEDISFISFKKKLQKYLNSYQIKKIEKAFDLAKDAHHGHEIRSCSGPINFIQKFLRLSSNR